MKKHFNTAPLFNLDQYARTGHPDDVDVADGDDNSVSPTDSSDTESFPEVASDDDSVSPTDSSDTESFPEVASDDDSVSTGDTESSLKYVPRGTARGGNKYFRFSYRWYGKMKHRHIPGGNVDSSIARSRWEEIQWMKRSGRSIEEILAAIDTWK